MDLDIEKCLKDEYKLNENCIDIGNYRVPKNSDFTKINPIIIDYIFKLSNNIKDAEREMNSYCSNLELKNCNDPCVKLGYKGFLTNEYCGYIEEKDTEKTSKIIIDTSQRFSSTVFILIVTGQIFKLMRKTYTDQIINSLFNILIFLQKFNFFEYIYV